MDVAAGRGDDAETLVFISYRRTDAASAATLLHGELSEQFGAASVFLDYESIPLGRDFGPELLARVRSSAVLLVVVGDRWLDGEIGQRPIDDPDDWVRREILEALKHAVPVVPVLLEGGTVVRDRLPPELAVLTNFQYFEIRDRRQRPDMQVLGQYLARQIPRLRDRPVQEPDVVAGPDDVDATTPHVGAVEPEAGGGSPDPLDAAPGSDHLQQNESAQPREGNAFTRDLEPSRSPKMRSPRVLVAGLTSVVVAGIVIWQLAGPGTAQSQDGRTGSPSSTSVPSTRDSESTSSRKASGGPSSRTATQVPNSSPPVSQPGSPRPDRPPPPSAELSPGSDSHLQNASTSQCVSGDGSVYPSFGTCSGSDSYVWKLRPSGGDTVELVNRVSGNCLSAPYNLDYSAGLGPCSGTGGTGYTSWRIGKTTNAGQTLKNTATGGCLAIDSPSYGGYAGVMVATCNSDLPQQLWRGGKKA